MYSLESHVNMAAIRGGKGHPIIINVDQIQDKLDTLTDIINQTGISTKETDDALKKLSQMLISAKEASDALKKLSQALAGPATPEATETQNENGRFDFLEQNAYTEDKDILQGEQPEKITPLDFDEKI